LIGTVTVLGAVALCLAVILGLQARAARQQAEVQAVKLESLNLNLEKQNAELRRRTAKFNCPYILSQAYTALSSGKLEEAEENFESCWRTTKAEKDLPAIARTHSSLGDIELLKRRDYPAAKTEYDTAVQILSKDPRFSNQVGLTLSKTAVLYFEWGKNREEQKDLKGAIQKVRDFDCLLQ
jgi:tetratricopeptide (TPR) repeat protein